MMSINRTNTWLFVGVQLLLVSVAAAQELPENAYVRGVDDVQLFAPADLSSYGNGPPRPRGWFFTVEGLQWGISKPNKTVIGKEGFNPLAAEGRGFAQPLPGSGNQNNANPGFAGLGFINQPSSVDTDFISDALNGGERIQFGYVEDGQGWLVGTTVLQGQVSNFVGGNVGVAFFAPFTLGISALEGFIPGPGGFDADLNGNNVYGRNGRDLGTPNANPPPAFTLPFDGIPDTPAPTDFGDLVSFPVFFDTLVAKNINRFWGVEVMHLWQFPSRPRGNNTWGFMAGTRYMRFQDNFIVEGYGDISPTPTPPNGQGGNNNQQGQSINGVLADSKWNTRADNNLIGPQIGLKFAHNRGRLSLVTEARFVAAANFQNFNQVGSIASRPQIAPSGQGGQGGGQGTVVTSLPGDAINLFPLGFQHNDHQTTFSPVGELRFDLKYQLFRSFSVNAGWTGTIMGGMARSANIIDYSLPDMGILKIHTRQEVFMQGVNFGAAFNY